ncbi:hypothetical protein CHS0354_025404 [Potamilus streckersoni]|uniref:Protein SMG9 n=1 Tax=Potamilus streckersoni TaxID=2493646 RepID=A0AAE0W0G2_9BIVA|nr:hypothetical protein CHS0354_025404 [Potamilus streckersoni]
MSDPIDRERGRSGRRRGRRGGGPPRKEKHDADSTPRPTIILAKPSSGPSSSAIGDSLQGTASVSHQSGSSASISPMGRQQEKPVMVLKAREEGRPLSSATSTPSIAMASGAGETTPSYHLQRTQSGPSGSQDGPLKLAAFPEMTKSVKLIDDMYQWCETANEMLLDQTDFLVVGVLGLQGVGKSTIMSLLAGNSPSDSYRSFVFTQQSKEAKEICDHQTNGLDIFVTAERIILIDTQPVLSASVMEHLIRNDKKFSTEYTFAENCVEIQSLQLAAFLMTVCHVVLVVQDWFVDTNFMHFLLTAEMLKPASHSVSHESGTGQEDVNEYNPHIVFIQNKAKKVDFSPENYKTMKKTIAKIFESSKLKTKGFVSMAVGKLIPALSTENKSSSNDINLFLMPPTDPHKLEIQDAILTVLPNYRGYPSFLDHINSLRSQILAIPRDQLTHMQLSEKNWFHYAARTWDAVKKSQLISEYNRLLS